MSDPGRWLFTGACVIVILALGMAASWLASVQLA